MSAVDVDDIRDTKPFIVRIAWQKWTPVSCFRYILAASKNCGCVDVGVRERVVALNSASVTACDILARPGAGVWIVVLDVESSELVPER